MVSLEAMVKKLLQVNLFERRAIAIATALAFVGAIYFLRAYLILVIVSAIVAFLFNPVYKKLVAKGRSEGSAASLTLVVSFLALIIPLSIIIIVTTYQVVSLIDNIKQSNYSAQYAGSIAQDVVNVANDMLVKVGINYTITLQSITESLKNSIETIANTLVKNAWSSISGIFGFITLAIIYIYVFMSMLKNQNKIIHVVHQINPLGKKISELYVARMASMTKAMVRGQFIIATMQGLTDAALLYIAGIQTGFLFFALILIALSIIPLGGGILVLPIGVVMLLTGNIVGGLIIILGHLFIVTNIDNVMRPRLVPEDARLDPALTLLAVFAGVGMFGFLGVILGPVIMIVIVTTLQVYLEVFKEEDAVKDADGPRSKVGLYKTLTSKLHIQRAKN